MKSLWIFCLALMLPEMTRAFEIADFKPNVVDSAEVLSADDTARINLEIEKLRTEGGVWAAVYIVPTLENLSIEEVASQTFKKWKLGDAGKNNGLLMMVAINDRKNRLEVGYGIEPTLTDAKASLILRSLVNPAFKQAHYAEGILSAFDEVIHIQKGSPQLSYGMESGATKIRKLGISKLIAIWLIGIWGLPFLIALIGLLSAALKKTQSYHEMAAVDLLSQCLGVTGKEWLFLKLFLTVNPGVFIILFQSGEMDMPFVPYVSFAVELLCFWFAALQSIQFWKRLFSHDLYKAFVQNDKSGKWKSGSGSSGFWSSGSGWSSGGSGGSSSSSSSSSGGGSSGGGGASSSW